MAVKNRRLIEIVGVLALIAIIAAGYRFAPMLAARGEVSVAVGPLCNLQRAPCEVDLPGGGKLSLGFMPAPVPLAKTFEIHLAISGAPVEYAEIDFAGADMSMGYNRLRFENRGNGQFFSEGRIPVCVTGRMTWIATLLMRANGQQISVPFRFESGG